MGKVIKGIGKYIIVALFFVLAIFCLILGIRVVAGQPADGKLIKEAVYVKDAKVYEENEGKIVIVPGKLEASTPVVDPATYISLDTISTYRMVQRFEKIHDSEAEGGCRYEWKNVINDYSAENNYGVNGKKIVSGTVTADTKIGEFNIDLRLLNGLTKSTDLVKYSPEMLKNSPLHIETKKRYDTVYLSEQYGIPYGDKEGVAWRRHEGDVRVSYKIANPDDPLKYTILAKQENGRLVDSDIDSECLYKGIKTREEILDKFKSSGIGGIIFYFLLTALFAFLGVRKILK